jgi:membrane protease YdiL (CAAX protease family)
MLIISKGRLPRYGFRLSGIAALKMPLISAAIIALVVLLFFLLLGSIAGLSPSDTSALPGADMSFLQVIIFIWLYASVCEEILFRGLIQTLLSPLKERGLKIFGVDLSVPVIIAALLFGLMHLALLSAGADLYSVLTITLSGVVLGIIAGYYREKLDSLILAILVHMVFNIWGTIISLI